MVKTTSGADEFNRASAPRGEGRKGDPQVVPFVMTQYMEEAEKSTYHAETPYRYNCFAQRFECYATSGIVQTGIDALCSAWPSTGAIASAAAAKAAAKTA